MRIYSAASYVDITPAETFYDVNLRQVLKDFWQAPRVLQEAAYLPTSTTNAGYFRQLTKYGISGVKKKYSLIVSAAEATTLQAMNNSQQTEWNVDTGTAVYLCMIVFDFSWDSGKTRCDLDISVLSEV